MKNKLTKREKLVYMTFISMLIAILLLYVVTDIYAQYASAFTGASSVNIKKWKVAVNDSFATSASNNTYSFDILTSDGSLLIEPDSTGTFAIKVENDSNVDAKYTITFNVKYKDTNILSPEFFIEQYDFTNSLQQVSSNNQISNSVVQRDISANVTDTLNFKWKWESTVNDYAILSNYSGFTITANVNIEEKI